MCEVHKTPREIKMHEIRSKLERLSPGKILDVGNLSLQEATSIRNVYEMNYVIREVKSDNGTYALQILRRSQ